VLKETMIDEIVAEAVRAHRKKFDWRVEQEGRDERTGIPRSAKDMAAFTPPSVARHQSDAVS